MADGGGCGASRVFPASVYEWVGGWDGSGEPWLRDALVRNVGVSYESTPTDLRRFFRFRGITGISRVGISQEVGVFARVVILE